MSDADTATARWLADLRTRHPDLELRPPAPARCLAAGESEVGALPDELRALYTVTNGLKCRSFTLLPLFDEWDPKRTWISLQRANAAGTTEALGGAPDLLRRFLVFADVSPGYACIDREDGTIWFEEDVSDEVSQTNLPFKGFVELMVAEGGMRRERVPTTSNRARDPALEGAPPRSSRSRT